MVAECNVVEKSIIDLSPDFKSGLRSSRDDDFFIGLHF